MNTVNVHKNDSTADGSIEEAREGERPTAPRPTIKDVARVAGVSYQTVSRVVNDMDTVKPVTRARVLEAIASTGWSPDEAAAALARRRTPAPAL